MENLVIEGTRKTPDVKFSPSGKLELKGRSIPEDPSKFYNSLYVWVTEYCGRPQDNTILDINLEYFNSGSSKSILHMLRELALLPKNGYKLTINWFYEQGDDDILERGEYYASLLDVKFNFIETE
jgi:hypothetical protein